MVARRHVDVDGQIVVGKRRVMLLTWAGSPPSYRVTLRLMLRLMNLPVSAGNAISTGTPTPCLIARALTATSTVST